MPCTFYIYTNVKFLFKVYKTQLERVSEGWKSRIGDFERVNMSLQTEVTKLQLENQDLKSKVSSVADWLMRLSGGKSNYMVSRMKKRLSRGQNSVAKSKDKKVAYLMLK